MGVNPLFRLVTCLCSLLEQPWGRFRRRFHLYIICSKHFNPPRSLSANFISKYVNRWGQAATEIGVINADLHCLFLSFYKDESVATCYFLQCPSRYWPSTQLRFESQKYVINFSLKRFHLQIFVDKKLKISISSYKKLPENHPCWIF